MNQALYRQKGFLSTLFTTLLIIAIAVVTDYFDTLFVPETGNLKIFGGIGIILAVGLIFKWNHVRLILSVISAGALIVLILFAGMARDPYIIPRLILSVALALSTYFLLFSKAVKTYVDRK